MMVSFALHGNRSESAFFMDFDNSVGYRDSRTWLFYWFWFSAHLAKQISVQQTIYMVHVCIHIRIKQ